MTALDTFLPSNATERRTLADIIFAKIDEAEDGPGVGDPSLITAAKAKGHSIHTLPLNTH
jgi:hypothetical protein